MNLVSLRTTGLLIAVAALMPCVASAQEISRWALGRPSLTIDLPAQPNSGGVAWAERSAYSIFPNSWTAEGSGVKVEVARIYTTKAPADLLTETAAKMAVSPSPAVAGKLSGRDLLKATASDREIWVVGGDGEISSGASWIVVVTTKDAAAKPLAARLLGSIKVEREGSRHWTLRSFGPTFIAAQLPFELQPAASDGPGRYESSFDGMSVRVSTETPSAGRVFNVETTLQDITYGERDMPGVSEFTSSSAKYKLGDREGMMITKDFKRGYRKYRVYELAFIEKSRAVTVTMQIDPARADHQQTVERILRSMRATLNPIYGWKTYKIGDDGLYVDLPAAPKPPRQLNAVTIYDSDSPLAVTEIRQISVSFPGGHAPDFAAQQYFEMQQALNSKTKFELVGIDKALIDGFEARIVKATWKNGENQNHRRILTIYGYDTQWIIDMYASKDTEAYMDRVVSSVRVRVPAGGHPRQSFGTMGVSFNIAARVSPNVVTAPSNPDLSREEIYFGEDGRSILAVYEMVFKEQSVPITPERGTFFFNSLVKGMGEGAKIPLTAALRDHFPVNIDGVEGLHMIFDLKGGNLGENSVVQGDFLLFSQDKKLFTLTVLTNYDRGVDARRDRGRILNTIRIGL